MFEFLFIYIEVLQCLFIIKDSRCNGFGVTVGDNRYRLVLKIRWNFRCYFFVMKNVADVDCIKMPQNGKMGNFGITYFAEKKPINDQYCIWTPFDIFEIIIIWYLLKTYLLVLSNLTFCPNRLTGWSSVRLTG